MKKLLLTLSGLALFASSSFAQSSYGIDTKKMRFGAYLAPTIAWMKSSSKTDDGKNYNIGSDGSKAGFMWGLMAEYYFQDNYALVTGLQMNMGGGKMTMDRAEKAPMAKTIDRASFDYNINFVEIPVAIKLRTDPVSNFRFFGQAGVTLGARVGRKAAYELSYYGDAANSTSDLLTATQSKDKLGSRATLSPGFAPVNFQMNLGIGAEYPLTDKLAAYVGIFFNNGFVPDMTNPQNYELYDNNNKLIDVNSTFKDGNVRFNNFALRLGIFF